MFSNRLCNDCVSQPSASHRRKERQELPSEFLWVPRYLLPYSFCPGVMEPETEVLGLSAERVQCRLLV